MKKIIIIIIAAVVVAGGVLAYIFLIPKAEKTFYYSTGDAFVVNVLDSSKLIKTTIVLGISQDKTDKLGDENAVLRDSILYVLRNQAEETYQRADLQDILSSQITERLNALYPVEEGERPLFLQAYFNDFVMQ